MGTWFLLVWDVSSHFFLVLLAPSRNGKKRQSTRCGVVQLFNLGGFKDFSFSPLLREMIQFD